jgi:hypothetical protein
MEVKIDLMKELDVLKESWKGNKMWTCLGWLYKYQ